MNNIVDIKTVINNQRKGLFSIVIAYLIIDYGRPQDWIKFVQILHPGIIIYGIGILLLIFNPPKTIPLLAKYIILFIVVMWIGSVFAYNNYRAFITTKDFSIFILGGMFPLMFFTDTYYKANYLFNVFVLLNTSIAFYGIFHNGTGVGSFLGDEGDFCLAMNIVIPFSYYLLINDKSKIKKLLFIFSILIFTLAVISSDRRGGLLGFVASAITIWVQSKKKHYTTIFLLFLTVIFFYFAPASYFERMSTIKTANQVGDTGDQRLYLWGMAWNMFLDNPVIGVGPSNYVVMNEYYESEFYKNRGLHTWGKVAHSVYFTLLPETGLMGTTIFIIIALITWKGRKRIRKDFREIQINNIGDDYYNKKTIYYMSYAIDAAIVSFFVTGTFLSALYYPHFWVLTAFSYVICNVYKNELNNKFALN